MAWNLEQAKELREAVRASDRVLMVGHLLRFHPAVTKLRELIDSGELGDVLYVYGNRVNLGVIREEENALWSLGVHDISVVLHLLDGRPVEVWARGEAYLQRDVEDVVFGYVKFDTGQIGHLHLSWLDPHKMRKMTVVGSKKMAVFDDMEPERKVTVYDKGPVIIPNGPPSTHTGDIYAPAICGEEPLRIECRAFLEAVRTGVVERAGVDEGLAVVEVLEAMDRSVEAGRRDAGAGGGAGVMWPAAEAPGLVLAPDAEIGEDVLFGAGVTVHEGTVLGDGVRIGDGAVLGKRPMLAARSTSHGALGGPLRLGAGCMVSAGAVLSAGSVLGDRCVVGDLATVRERCTIGDDVVIGRGVCVENDNAIGSRTRIQTNAYITAHCVLEEDVFIAPCVVTTNDNFMGRTEARHALTRGATIRRGARVGGAATLLPGVEIGEEAFVGAGALVLRDVPPRVRGGGSAGAGAARRARRGAAREPVTAAPRFVPRVSQLRTMPAPPGP